MTNGYSIATWTMSCLVLLLLAPLAVAQEKAENLQVVLREPELLVTVVLPGGRVPTKEDVLPRIDGACAEVKEVSELRSSDVSFGTLFLVDASKSMGKALPSVQAALKTWIAGMAEHEVGIVASFGDEVTGVDGVWLGRDQKDALGQQVDALRASGEKTLLYEALHLAADRLSRSDEKVPLRTIVVFSDGLDEGSRADATLDGAKAKAKENDIRVNAVGYRLTKENHTGSLKSIAEDTGGKYLGATTPEEISRNFQNFQEVAHKLVLVRLEVSEVPAGMHEVGLEIHDGEAVRDPSVLKKFPSRFRGTLTDCDVQGWRSMAWLVGGTSVALLVIGALWVGFAGRAQRRREQEMKQQIQSAQHHAQQTLESRLYEVERAATSRAKRVVLSSAEGHPIILFEPGAFSVRFLGSDPGRADVVLGHTTVSGRHASLERRADDPDAIYVTDLGSSNGTYHQGLDIRGRGTIRVGNRERLQFGLLAMFVEMPEV